METVTPMTLDELYISPFTARRVYDEEGRVSYIPLQRNTTPTGLRHLDFILQQFAAGHTDLHRIARQLGCWHSDLCGFIHVLTGLDAREFRRQFLFRHADDLLRYTSLTPAEVARRVGAGSASNLGQLYRDHLNTTPRQQRLRLRQPRDIDRYRI